MSRLETPIMRDVHSLIGEACFFGAIGSLACWLFNKRDQRREEEQHQENLQLFYEWAFAGQLTADPADTKNFAIATAKTWNARHGDLMQADYRIGLAPMMQSMFKVWESFHVA